MKKKVVFYTQVYYTDAALEFIKVHSQRYEFHVIIEIAPESSNANIFNLSVDLNIYPYLVRYEDVADAWNIRSFSFFFKDCKSVLFAIHSHKRSLTLNSILRAAKIGAYIVKLKPHFIHFDDISLRQIGLMPILLYLRSKFILNVHDPTPHTGEKDIKKDVYKRLNYYLAKKFICFSSYSATVLKDLVTKNKKIFVLYLLPYTVYESFKSEPQTILPNNITFIGRVSPYKGIDLFIDAINEIAKKHPNQKFLIAGNPIKGYDIGHLKKLGGNVSFILKHLSTQEVTAIINQSQIVVCPYIDATQSGVVMTAYGLGCPVIVTPVGGLPEYVIDNVTGNILESTSVNNLVMKLSDFLEQGNYLKYNQNITKGLLTSTLQAHNLLTIDKIYI